MKRKLSLLLAVVLVLGTFSFPMDVSAARGVNEGEKAEYAEVYRIIDQIYDKSLELEETNTLAGIDKIKKLVEEDLPNAYGLLEDNWIKRELKSEYNHAVAVYDMAVVSVTAYHAIEQILGELAPNVVLLEATPTIELYETVENQVYEVSSLISELSREEDQIDFSERLGDAENVLSRLADEIGIIKERAKINEEKDAINWAIELDINRKEDFSKIIGIENQINELEASIEFNDYQEIQEEFVSLGDKLRENLKTVVEASFKERLSKSNENISENIWDVNSGYYTTKEDIEYAILDIEEIILRVETYVSTYGFESIYNSIYHGGKSYRDFYESHKEELPALREILAQAVRVEEIDMLFAPLESAIEVAISNINEENLENANVLLVELMGELQNLTEEERQSVQGRYEELEYDLTELSGVLVVMRELDILIPDAENLLEETLSESSDANIIELDALVASINTKIISLVDYDVQDIYISMFEDISNSYENTLPQIIGHKNETEIAMEHIGTKLIECETNNTQVLLGEIDYSIGQVYSLLEAYPDGLDKIAVQEKLSGYIEGYNILTEQYLDANPKERVEIRINELNGSMLYYIEQTANIETLEEVETRKSEIAEVVSYYNETLVYLEQVDDNDIDKAVIISDLEDINRRILDVTSAVETIEAGIQEHLTYVETGIKFDVINELISEMKAIKNLEMLEGINTHMEEMLILKGTLTDEDRIENANNWYNALVRSLENTITSVVDYKMSDIVESIKSEITIALDEEDLEELTRRIDVINGKINEVIYLATEHGKEDIRANYEEDFIFIEEYMLILDLNLQVIITNSEFDGIFTEISDKIYEIESETTVANVDDLGILLETLYIRTNELEDPRLFSVINSRYNVEILGAIEHIQEELDLVIALDELILEIEQLIIDPSDIFELENKLNIYFEELQGLVYYGNISKYTDIYIMLKEEVDYIIDLEDTKNTIINTLTEVDILLRGQENSQDEETVIAISEMLDSVDRYILYLPDGELKVQFRETHNIYTSQLEVVREKLFEGNPRLQVTYYIDIIYRMIDELYMLDVETPEELNEYENYASSIREIYANTLVIFERVSDTEEGYEDLDLDLEDISIELDGLSIDIEINRLYMFLRDIGKEFYEVHLDLENGVFFNTEHILELYHISHDRINDVEAGIPVEYLEDFEEMFYEFRFELNYMLSTVLMERANIVMEDFETLYEELYDMYNVKDFSLSTEELLEKTRILKENGKILYETVEISIEYIDVINESFGSELNEEDLLEVRVRILENIDFLETFWYSYASDKGVNIYASKTKIHVNEEMNLGHDVEYLNPIWLSSNEEVVKITEDGTIKGLTVGKATITLKLDGENEDLGVLESTLEIEVVKKPVDNSGSSSTTTTKDDKQAIKESKEYKEISQSVIKEIPFTVIKGSGLEKDLKAKFDKLYGGKAKVEIDTSTEGVVEVKLTVEGITTKHKIEVIALEDNSDFVQFEGNHWAKEYINDVVKKGYIKGGTNGDLMLENNIKTSDTFVSLNRLLSKKGLVNTNFDREAIEVLTSELPEAWYKYHIQSLLSMYNDDSAQEKISLIDVDKEITREEIAQILYKALNRRLKETIMMIEYKDLNEATNREAIEFCTRTGILRGNGSGEVKPKEKLTRAELITILSRLDSLIEEI